jgi:hypothetical protein
MVGAIGITETEVIASLSSAGSFCCTVQKAAFQVSVWPSVQMVQLPECSAREEEATVQLAAGMLTETAVMVTAAMATAKAVMAAVTAVMAVMVVMAVEI